MFYYIISYHSYCEPPISVPYFHRLHTYVYYAARRQKYCSYIITLYYLYMYMYIHQIPIYDNIIHTDFSVRGFVQRARQTFGVSVFAGVCDTCPRGDCMNAMIRSGVNFSTFLGVFVAPVKRVCQSALLVQKICIMCKWILCSCVYTYENHLQYDKKIIIITIII